MSALESIASYYESNLEIESVLARLLEDVCEQLSIEKVALMQTDNFSLPKVRHDFQDCVLTASGALIVQGTKPTVPIPIGSEGQAFTHLVFSNDHDAQKAQSTPIFEELCEDLCHRLKLLQVLSCARASLGREFLLFGDSTVARECLIQVSEIARTDLRVSLVGEYGCSLLDVAFAIHSLSSRREGPFVEFKCSAWDRKGFLDELKERLLKAQGGTLFLSDVDALPISLLRQFPKVLGSTLGQWWGSQSAQKSDGRLIVSSQTCLIELAENGDFSTELALELAMTQIEVPSLRERVEDIVEHLVFLGKRMGRADISITEDAERLIKAYRWPYNFVELESVAVKVLRLCPNHSISAENFSRFIEVPADLLSDQECDCKNQQGVNVDEFINDVFGWNVDALKNLHPGLKRAIEFISDNFQEELTTDCISKHAMVSPSHLSFLFKQQVGVTIRQLVIRLRIEQAKSLLTDHPEMRITDVSLQVGFGDLSNFLKSFKRVVGVTPKIYRKEAAQTEIQVRAD